MQITLPEISPIDGPVDLSKPLADALCVRSAAGEFRIKRVRLSGGLSSGVELILVDNGNVRAAICPTRGMGLWKMQVGDCCLGWDSPVPGPVHPSFVALNEPSGLGWLEGFDELFVRCGLQGFGPPVFAANGQLAYPLHGRIANLPARSVEFHLDHERASLSIVGQVCETRFLQHDLRLTAKYTFQVGKPSVQIHDQLLNASSSPADAHLLYHINVGKPLLGAGSRMVVSADNVVPRDARAAEGLSEWSSYQAPEEGYTEQAYFFDSRADAEGWGGALLTSPDAAQGFVMRYKTENLPCFTQWKNTLPDCDGYVTGMEPGTGFPNPRAFEIERGRGLHLQGRESRDFHLELEAVSTRDGVAQWGERLEAARGGKAVRSAELDPQRCLPHT
ncbi:aldose 1-epimerase family protein [Aureliella helgolandensis]|uniref:DUF4432 domain-containing protein n=1 Tax=Aureliella helgolandensis TaxID=2527968 RepID=A0A518GHI2_9BACT|nr:aldose 1-epimerase family protein [Aureliella helgolandensis]QDV28055.1 hypothetical protein Q31a_64480 [Aureliella helgolandensis]